MSKLVAQYESDPDSLNRTFGVTVHTDEAEGYFTYRVHSRRYEGIMVIDAWSSDHVRLDAGTQAAAITEANGKYREWRKSLTA